MMHRCVQAMSSWHCDADESLFLILVCFVRRRDEETFCIRPAVTPFSDLVIFCHFGHWSIFFKENLHDHQHEQHHQYYLLDHLDHVRLEELRKWIVLIATPNNSHSVWPAESYSCRSVPSVKQQSQIMELNVHRAVFKRWALVCTFVHTSGIQLIIQVK